MVSNLTSAEETLDNAAERFVEADRGMTYAGIAENTVSAMMKVQGEASHLAHRDDTHSGERKKKDADAIFKEVTALYTELTAPSTYAGSEDVEQELVERLGEVIEEARSLVAEMRR